VEELMSNAPASVNGVSPGMLKEYIDRWEVLEGQKQGAMDDISSLKMKAKKDGFDTKTMSKVVARRKKKPEAVQEEDLRRDTYERAIESIEDPESNEAAA
jgi:uncharacterized protein (UPF0335 family)